VKKITWSESSMVADLDGGFVVVATRRIGGCCY